MILYVNGDSHAAAAEAVNPHAFAEDDPELYHIGRAPHPQNLAVSWGKLLSQSIRATFHCDAESASSNTRIIRTTRQWLNNCKITNDVLLIIQWSTWEREEWLHNDVYYQINGSGIDSVPKELEQKYKEFVVNIDWNSKIKQAHNDIWSFHRELEDQSIKHIFFNGNNDFSRITNRFDWGNSYIGPYDPTLTYNAIICSKGIKTVAPNSWHFGKDGHSYFHRFMLQYIIDNNLIVPNEISAD